MSSPALPQVTFENLRDVIVDWLGCDPADVKPEARLVEDLGADSLALVELVLACEEKFEIDIPDDDVRDLATVGDALAVCARIAAGIAA